MDKDNKKLQPFPDLPEWTGERDLYVMAGLELVAYKHQGDVWKVKTSRCSMCGTCCENIGKYPGTEFFPINKDGSCGHLKNDGYKRVCGLGVSRPFSCSIGLGLNSYSGSTERFEES